jgi:signal transduction histidine kinase
LLETIAERLGKIIERRQAQTELVESEKRFRDLVGNSLTGISLVQENQVVYQNQEQARLLGPLPRSYVLADFDRIHPDDVAKVKRLSLAIAKGNLPTIDTDFRLYSTSKKDSNAVMIWVYCRALLTDYRGKEAILVNMIDMTKSKELEHLLTVQDKMASLGRVAAGIAHEIRNPLSGINIYLNILKKNHHRDGSEDKVNQILEKLQSASNKIESVIRRVMDFAKPSEPKLTLTDINQPILEAIQLTDVTLRKSGTTIIKNLAGDLPRSYIDPSLIEEMILNLLNNAMEAMKSMDKGKKIAVFSAVEKDRIVIRISDSGPGVPLEIRGKIFDPYFTTKTDGTGIGLSLSHRIVTDHGGSLTVSDSELGGAEFRIEIPVKSSAVRQPLENSSPSKEPGKH